MANKLNFSTKRVAISKANTQIMIVVAIASVLSVFALVAAKTLWSEQGAQARLIHAKEQARDQLKANVAAVDKLMASYKDFESQDPNIIGGKTTDRGDRGGDNAKIVLDALPSQYDYPALASSIQKIANNLHLNITDFSGTDDEVNQQATPPSSSPAPVAIPFQFTVDSANYDEVKRLIKTLEHSIRPIQIQQLTIKGSSDQMQATIAAQTFYQPGKVMSIRTEAIQ